MNAQRVLALEASHESLGLKDFSEVTFQNQNPAQLPQIDDNYDYKELIRIQEEGQNESQMKSVLVIEGSNLDDEDDEESGAFSGGQDEKEQTKTNLLRHNFD
eukprot:CAMPEP_0170557500 /NCGR_PEP_ID=MMETSP0211-20121228/26701_1 /TAXON_ID=311385 /ORGANISM="Pseudokeronopsis sp., Strain OXSARD2" /LENGTH=101 /DNA_ID=CAMNT_0010868597 /DNA_START=766 /DNA_END=1071 /DNA_ORIENTATION=-